jgi:Fe-Mn family superoxide dismutase
MSQPNHSLSRRRFLQQTPLAAAGGLLGLSGLSAAPSGPEDFTTSAAEILFSVPLLDSGLYALPKLGYAYDALEPHIDAQTMELHHSKHFEGYRRGLNVALNDLKEMRAAERYRDLEYRQKKLAFHGAGYLLHHVFFQNMTPGGRAPSDALRARAAEHFGSFEAMVAHFSEAAAQVEGSGWAILAWQPAGARALILQAEKHQLQTQWNLIPLLAIDVWEHAYYLRYQNERKRYIEAFQKVVDWRDVENRWAAAQSLTAIS